MNKLVFTTSVTIRLTGCIILQNVARNQKLLVFLPHKHNLLPKVSENRLLNNFSLQAQQVSRQSMEVSTTDLMRRNEISRKMLPLPRNTGKIRMHFKSLLCLTCQINNCSSYRLLYFPVRMSLSIKQGSLLISNLHSAFSHCLCLSGETDKHLPPSCKEHCIDFRTAMMKLKRKETDSMSEEKPKPTKKCMVCFMIPSQQYYFLIEQY